MKRERFHSSTVRRKQAIRDRALDKQVIEDVMRARLEKANKPALVQQPATTTVGNPPRSTT